MADIDLQNISIPKFYAGRHIFITGGSGFIGKVLVEKILRSCPDIAGLHVLLRAKKGVSPTERLNTITKNELFDVLRNQNPSFTEKLHNVNGDISLPGLGLDPHDREFLVKNVSVVFHAAATVRFNDSISHAVRINVGGAREVALMAKEMKNLVVFVHVSSTYSNTDKKVIEEKLYPPHGNWRILLEGCEKLDPSAMTLIGPKIQGNLPNTYTFTKSLGEHCIHDTLEGKPLVIVRPSVVISTIEEPIKGWIDNFNGPIGLLSACGKGAVHISLGRNETATDYIPVDVVVKILLIAAFKHGSKQLEESNLPVYNCSSPRKNFTMREIRELLLEISAIYPLNDMLWLPAGLITPNHFLLLVGTIVLHMIPATILDVILRFHGQEPRLANLHRTAYFAQIMLEPFILNSWKFNNEKALALENDIPDQDRDDFSFDFHDIDNLEVIRRMQLGARRYLFKESDDTLPAARLHRKRLILIKNVITFFGIVFLAWFFLRRLL